MTVVHLVLHCALRIAPGLSVERRAHVRVTNAGGESRVRLDGAALPCDGWVPVGRHRLEITRVGYEPWSEAFSLRAGEDRAFTPILHETASAPNLSDMPARRHPARRGAAMIASGVAMFAAGYIGGIVDLALFDREISGTMVIPVVGPWLVYANANWGNDTNASFAYTLLIGQGLLQAIGVIALTAGAVRSAESSNCAKTTSGSQRALVVRVTPVRSGAMAHLKLEF